MPLLVRQVLACAPRAACPGGTRLSAGLLGLEVHLLELVVGDFEEVAQRGGHVLPSGAFPGCPGKLIHHELSLISSF